MSCAARLRGSSGFGSTDDAPGASPLSSSFPLFMPAGSFNAPGTACFFTPEEATEGTPRPGGPAPEAHCSLMKKTPVPVLGQGQGWGWAGQAAELASTPGPGLGCGRACGLQAAGVGGGSGPTAGRLDGSRDSCGCSGGCSGGCAVSASSDEGLDDVELQQPTGALPAECSAPERHGQGEHHVLGGPSLAAQPEMPAGLAAAAPGNADADHHHHPDILLPPLLVLDVDSLGCLPRPERGLAAARLRWALCDAGRAPAGAPGDVGGPDTDNFATAANGSGPPAPLATTPSTAAATPSASGVPQPQPPQQGLPGGAAGRTAEQARGACMLVYCSRRAAQALAGTLRELGLPRPDAIVSSAGAVVGGRHTGWQAGRDGAHHMHASMCMCMCAPAQGAVRALSDSGHHRTAAPYQWSARSPGQPDQFGKVERAPRPTLSSPCRLTHCMTPTPHPTPHPPATPRTP